MPPASNKGASSGASEGEARRNQEREEFLGNLGDPPIRQEALQPPVSAESARAAVDPELGVVVLNGPAIRLITTRLRERMTKDPQLKARFYENPRAILASVGLNDENQTEILRVDRDFGASPFLALRADGGDWCITTECCCTTCCLSCWFSF